MALRHVGMEAAVSALAPRDISAGWSSPVARQAHNLKVVGSNPTPASIFAGLAQRECSGPVPR
jgi:hypothetical protein